MNLRNNQIGFSQRVRLEWLEQTANLVLAGNERPAVLTALQDLLKDKVSVGGNAERGNREKVITILMKTWINVPPDLETLRAGGLELLRRLPGPQRMAVHWGMVTAVYPFWGAVAACVGRLLKLQNSATAAHVQRRLREQYGERETVSRATRRVLRSYSDWGVLKDAETKGVYRQGLALPIEDPALTAWLVEASLHALSDGSAALRALLVSPSLFPFRFSPGPVERMLTASAQLDVVRLGLDEEVVMLRK